MWVELIGIDKGRMIESNEASQGEYRRLKRVPRIDIPSWLRGCSRI